jgi:hypothetical protein
MKDAAPSDATLALECELFSYYLGASQPTAYVSGKYAEACARLADERAAAPFERWLLRFARRGPLRARMADVWARFRAPNTLLRRRLILLLAILESTREARALDSIAPRTRIGFLAAMKLRALVSILLLVVGLLYFPCARPFVSGNPREAQA